jgi:ATP-dependent DNA helicase RecG
MPKIDWQESETLEFKRQWTERALEGPGGLCQRPGAGHFWSAPGGDGEIVGTTADDREIQPIANLIASHLGITPSMQVLEMKRRPVLEIQAEPATGLRVGTTKRDFAPEEVARHLLERSRRTWDGLPSEFRPSGPLQAFPPGAGKPGTAGCPESYSLRPGIC